MPMMMMEDDGGGDDDDDDGDGEEDDDDGDDDGGGHLRLRLSMADLPPAARRPRPSAFPFFRGTPLPPWCPRGWYIPAAATSTEYAMTEVMVRESMVRWHLPDGKVQFVWEGPPGLSPVLLLILEWGGSAPGCQG